MNRNFKLAAILVMLAVTAASAISAADRRLSPALEHVAAEYSMVKSGSGENIRFSAEDFESSVGAHISSITLTALPPDNDGTLVLGEAPVSAGQTISGANLSLLRFIPSGASDETSFKFTAGRSYTTECIIKLSDRASNASPCVGSSAVSAATFADITYVGRLDGSDPDGDDVHFEITSYPESGIAEITDASAGVFSYTPYSGYTGRDSFTYRISDSLGAYSEPCTVTLDISPRRDGTEFSDMSGNPAYNAAVSLVSDGIMDAIDEHGTLWFDPDEGVSREEYVKTVMRALGAPELSSKSCGFSDSADINDDCSGYVYAARRLGIVSGYTTDCGTCFRPNEMITGAEAALIISRITGAECDADAAWDDGAIDAVSRAGIVSDYELFAAQPLTRAQMAQLIYNTRSLYNV